ncbi:hypothetical protein [Anaerolentibacter hominis]|uniref:hypothetical protein n=1 Tax=Anaerolentibacter hominis TaxID=3079009 RepID=UPI0031B802E2
MEDTLKMILEKLNKLDVLEGNYTSLEEKYESMDRKLDQIIDLATTSDYRLELEESRSELYEKEIKVLKASNERLNKITVQLATRLDILEEKVS